MAETTHPIDIAVGRRIAALRMGRGMTQTQLGQAMGVTFQQVQKYESGRNRISASKMYEAAQALDARVSDLFDGIEADMVTAPDQITPAERRLLKAIKSLDQREIGALADCAQALGNR